MKTPTHMEGNSQLVTYTNRELHMYTHVENSKKKKRNLNLQCSIINWAFLEYIQHCEFYIDLKFA